MSDTVSDHSSAGNTSQRPASRYVSVIRWCGSAPRTCTPSVNSIEERQESASSCLLLEGHTPQTIRPQFNLQQPSARPDLNFCGYFQKPSGPVAYFYGSQQARQSAAHNGEESLASGALTVYSKPFQQIIWPLKRSERSDLHGSKLATKKYSERLTLNFAFLLLSIFLRDLE